MYKAGEESRGFRATFTGNYGEKLGEEATQEERDNADAQKTQMLADVFSNRLRRIHPVYNARFDYVEKARAYFRKGDKN